MTRMIIGTRGSKLALWQANMVADTLRTVHAGLEVTIEVIRTSGDRIQDVPLAQVAGAWVGERKGGRTYRGKGLFVKEIEEALVAGRVDIAVHSLKDVPDTVPDGLVLAAFLPREVPWDAFVSEQWERLMELPEGARVGTSSLRRAAQVRAVRPDLEIVPLRGNVDTRLRRLREGLDAVVLAGAGLRRLGHQDRIREWLTPPEFIPAVGQGVVVVECRAADTQTRRYLRALDHEETRLQVRAERAFLAAIGGGCQVPLGAHARVENGQVAIVGMIARPDGSLVLRDEVLGDLGAPEKVGEELARRLLDRGGREVLRELEEHPPWKT